MAKAIWINVLQSNIYDRYCKANLLGDSKSRKSFDIMYFTMFICIVEILTKVPVVRIAFQTTIWTMWNTRCHYTYFVIIRHLFAVCIFFHFRLFKFNLIGLILHSWCYMCLISSFFDVEYQCSEQFNVHFVQKDSQGK